jgi:uncharacterized membrane protein
MNMLRSIKMRMAGFCSSRVAANICFLVGLVVSMRLGHRSVVTMIMIGVSLMRLLRRGLSDTIVIMKSY